MSLKNINKRDNILILIKNTKLNLSGYCRMESNSAIAVPNALHGARDRPKGRIPCPSPIMVIQNVALYIMSTEIKKFVTCPLI